MSRTIDDLIADAVLSRPINEMTRQTGSTFTIFSGTGRRFGGYAIRKQARKGLAQIEFFKSRTSRSGDSTTTRGRNDE